MQTRLFQIPRGSSDLMKIIAAILVALSHYCNIKATTGVVLNPIEWLIRSQGGNVGVAIFFFLSGYGLMMSEMRNHLNFKQFVKRRFLKIYLPVLLITALWLPLAYIFFPDNNMFMAINSAGGGYPIDYQRFVYWI